MARGTLQRLVFTFLLLAVAAGAEAQVSSPDARPLLQKMLDSITTYGQTNTVQKLYLHTDKPDYFRGDTLWFKAYLFQADRLDAKPEPEILHLEISDDNQRMIRNQVIQLYTGIGWGNFALPDKDFPPGNYTLRAYTNWMRNFDPNYFFTKSFAISADETDNWLVSSRVQTVAAEKGLTANTRLTLTTTGGKAVAWKELEVRILAGNRTLNRAAVRTDGEGVIEVNFPVPEKNSERVSVKLTTPKNASEAHDLQFPLVLNQQRAIDLQFLPEGGHLIAAVPGKVAFKAIAEDGRGIDVQGSVYNQLQEKVAEFKSTHLGMGSFDFLPKTGETYHARLISPGAGDASFLLTALKSSGASLQVRNTLQSDSVFITVKVSPDLTGRQFYLIGQSRGTGIFGSTVTMTGVRRTVAIPKKTFPTGIVQLSLTTLNGEQLSRRIFYVNREDFLLSAITPAKTEYARRDSVRLDILVKDSDDKPVTGAFSLAVTDNSQVNADPTKNGNILSTVFLSSELKGHVENPGYYFPWAMSPEIWENLDNLLLTQGWVGFSRATPRKEEPAAGWSREPTYAVSGRVTNSFNKAVEGVHVALLARKPISILDTVTDKNGVFRFENLFPADSAVYFLQTRNKRGKSFNVNIELDEVTAPPFTATTDRRAPWYFLVDTTSRLTLKNRVAYRLEQEKLLGIRQLKEVVLIGKKVIKTSKNLNGPGESDFAITEEEVVKLGRQTLESILEKNVKGFQTVLARGYRLNFQAVHFIIDGVEMDFLQPEGISYYNFIHPILEYITAEDVVGIEVMNAKYVLKYAIRFLDPMTTKFWDHAFIEVTTRSGHGAFMSKTPGTAVLRPPTFAAYNEFYSPKYRVKSETPFIDTRPTVYWNPNIITDKDGKASVSFYTTDRAGSYTMLLEGASMAGALGSVVGTVTVK